MIVIVTMIKSNQRDVRESLSPFSISLINLSLSKVIFAGLPPSFADRSKLDSEKLFQSSDGSVLQDAKNAYLQDTNHFDKVISSQESLHRGVRIEISYLESVAQYMNESSRAQQFLEHTCTAVSHGNLAYFNNLKRGLDWGINAMFCAVAEPLRRYYSDQSIQLYGCDSKYAQR
ncbi:hypothetical protein HCEG_03721 [Histoplasma capsulatum var. duboisii H88]|uniref:Uncharacterized protein n=1 Tax=Ajellomyces capsulatus (strain H88) TaxID=544711 RepID=F0UDT3_AJEC8|nr:hypothetical protein HCEG_03721 [Histoplasma capsulatum var. duboisii H88]